MDGEPFEGINQRPNPAEDEDDLLKLQQQFLNSRASQLPAASVKSGEKRKKHGPGEAASESEMEGIHIGDSVQLSTKKFKQEWESTSDKAEAGETFEDLERVMDSKDTSVAAVLTSIIERDTSNELCAIPRLGSQAFPTVRPVDFSKKNSQKSPDMSRKKKKKSLFAQQVEAQGVQHFGVDLSKAKPVPLVQRQIPAMETSQVTGSCILDGGGLSATNKAAEVEQIHQENAEKLAAMSEQEILEEQRKLLEMMDPKLVDFLRKKRTEASSESTQGAGATSGESFSVLKERMKLERRKAKEPPESDLPIQPSKEWLHMDTVERDKLEWLKDLPPPPSAQGLQTGRPARFDFEGNILAVDLVVPVNLGLHHHGEEPERAGYTLEEIFQLSRSSNQQQRILALHTLARVISKAKSGVLSNKVETPIIPSILSGGVVMLLRWALDDGVVAGVAAAVDVLHALLWHELDETAVEETWPWFQGSIISALTPSATLERESRPQEMDEENQEEETDADIVRRDVVQALILRMDLLVRFRYILDTMRPQAETVIQMLQILTRIAQHSLTATYEIVKCPGLLEGIVREFIPTVSKYQGGGLLVSCVYGIPLPAAVRLIRVLCQSGRNLAASLASKYQLSLLILRYLSVNFRDIQLPEKEAVCLQIEFLSLWRVCATYGLATQTYFDLYSDLTASVAKFENHWAESAVSVSHTHLVCVLEAILHISGQTSKTPDSSTSAQLLPYDMNWSHVSFLAQPLVACTKRILGDLGASYQLKKPKLHFPTACLNILASFYTLEGHQRGVDQVASLEGIEQLCSSCLEPFISSYGLRVIIEHLDPCSNLLARQDVKDDASSPNLPTHGVLLQSQTSVVVERENISDATSPNLREQFATNMPILGKDSPFGFVTALLRLALSVCKRHKAMISKILSPLVRDKDLFVYMKKTCIASNSSPFCHALFTRFENLLHHVWLKCCTLVPCEDMSIAHRVALNLLSRLGHGDEYLAHDLISTVVFSQAFLCEGADLEQTSAALASLSLNDLLHLKSATQEEITVSRSHLLQEVYNSLAKIRGHYLMAFGGMEKAVAESRYLFMGRSMEIVSQMLKCAGETLLPKDWVYLPLIHVYNRAVQSQLASGISASPQAVSMVTSVLQWSYALEIWRPAEMNQVSVTVRLSRILCAFIAGNDLFLEKSVNKYLAGLLRVFSAGSLLEKMDFEEKIPGMTSFYDFYQEVLEHYEAVSFGDAVFGLFVMLPLQQRHSSMLRKAVWAERRKMLCTLRIPLTELLVPVEAYLEPQEHDLELLQLQLTLLTSGAVQCGWSPVLYLVALHHVNRFLYAADTRTTMLSNAETDTEADMDERRTARERMWGHVVAHRNQVDDIIFYKHVDMSQPRGFQLYPALPACRQTTLDQYTAKFRQP